jgi:hypothetical protein
VSTVTAPPRPRLSQAMDLNRRGRQVKDYWWACDSMSSLGEAMCGWLAGTVPWSPSYMGGPHGETVRHLSLMCRLNRSGMVTDGMNDNNEGVPNAMLYVFVRRSRVPRLYVACRRYGVEVADARHRNEQIGYYADYVQPSAVEEMERARFVLIQDPVPGRFSRRTPLWRALRDYTRAA